MNTRILRYCLFLLALGCAAGARADDPKAAPVESHTKHLRVIATDKDVPKETVTFLGVETSPPDPALADQLGLPEGTGLVVRRIMPDSPAAAALKQHDILTKFGDQVLVDQHQLSVLVRARKAGDEVALTLYRGGKEMNVPVKLATRETPRLSEMEGFGPGNAFRYFFRNGGFPGADDLRDLPGMAREDIDNVMRTLGRDHFNLMVRPQVRVIERKGHGSTILDLAQGNVVFTDDAGAVEINAHDGHRELTVKNPKGNVTFKGDITSEEDRRKLPPEVTARLNQIEKIDVGIQSGEDFQHEGVTLDRTKKIRYRELPLRRLDPVELRSF